MKFKVRPAGSLEIAGITRIVQNEVRIENGNKKKVGDTFLWKRITTKRGDRWIKVRFADENSVSNDTIIDGCELDEMHELIVAGIESKYVDVWFSGNTCNLEENLTVKDQLTAQMRDKMTELLKKGLKGFILEMKEMGAKR